MSIETDHPDMTRPISDALLDALTKWTHPTYLDQEDTRG